jgi:hypothetical protein
MKKQREKYRRKEGAWERRERKGSNYAAVSIFWLTYNGNFN